MLKKDFLSMLDITASNFTVGNLEIEPFTMSFYPWNDFKNKALHLSIALITRVHNPADNSRHTVVISYMQDEWKIWCGDTFLEGRLDKVDADTRMSTVVEQAKESAQGRVAEQMKDVFGQYPQENNNCDFWREHKKTKGNYLCDHTKAALVELHNNPKLIDDMELHYAAATQEGVELPGDADKGRMLVSISALAFRVPVLTEGDRGSGKTFEARALARENGYAYVELNGHEGVEAQDMLGYLIPDGQSGLVWKDGPLSEAFRKASRKVKTVLTIDEMLRIPQRQLSVLLTALSPDMGVYRLRTGRVASIEDGVAVEEVLEAPLEYLAVVATTNIGAEYAVDTLDPALSERFFLLRKDTNEEELRRVLGEKVAKKKFSKALVSYLVSFWRKATELKVQGRLNEAPTLRTLERAVDLADQEDDIKVLLKGMALQWVARDADGHPVRDQIKTVEQLVDRTNSKGSK